MKMGMKDKDVYSSRDLGESAFLYASGVKISKIKQETGGVIWFVFHDRKKCLELTDSFWKKDVCIDALTFSEALKTLKSIIFKKKRER